MLAHLHIIERRKQKLSFYIAKNVLITQKGVKKNNGLLHLDLTNYIQDGRINWPVVRVLVKQCNIYSMRE